MSLRQPELTDFDVPRELASERVVLGSMLSSTAAAELGCAGLVEDDFFDRDLHRQVFRTIAGLLSAHEPVSPVTVLSRLVRAGVTDSDIGPLLHGLYREAQPLASLPFYIHEVADAGGRRRLVRTLIRLHQRALNPQGATAGELVTAAVEEITLTNVAELQPDAADDRLTVDDLLAEPPGYDWLLPHLFERGDRLILTGAEGAGKSTLTRQIAVCAAAGLQPFTLAPCPAQRVMVVDCENSRRLTQRRYRPLLLAAKGRGWAVAGDAFELHCRPQGVDLASRAGESWLLRKVEDFKPDLLVIGPLYRLHIGDPADEREARKVAVVLDRARALHGAGLIVEAHAPHAQVAGRERALRPAGSSLWMRWPEFGLGLRLSPDDPHAMQFRVMDLKEWRGNRDERAWPRRIRRGTPWPWVIDGEE